MATRKTRPAELRQVQAAWRKAKTAWKRVENSLATMVDADKDLFHTLGEAGSSVTRQARKELDTAVRTLNQTRKTAVKKIDRLMKQRPFGAGKRTRGVTRTKTA